jgi:uncharacterized membrane protein
MRTSRIVIAILIVGFVIQAAMFYPSLPETMAAHFDAAGQANNWTSKPVFFLLEGIILLVIIFEFSVVPLIIEKTPEAKLNLPNKEYWLAPERRAGTYLVFRQFFEWFSVLLLLLFIIVNQLVFNANLRHEDLNATAIWIVIVTFILFVIVSVAKLLRSFRIPTI